MILLFLGSWRSTLIIAVSIPLSVMCSLLMLAALGETHERDHVPGHVVGVEPAESVRVVVELVKGRLAAIDPVQVPHEPLHPERPRRQHWERVRDPDSEWGDLSPQAEQQLQDYLRGER